MRNVFTIVQDNTDFNLLKDNGTRGVIIKNTDKLRENVKMAAASGMEILVELSAESVEKIKKLSADTDQIVFLDEEISYVGINDIKSVQSVLESGENEVSGFIIPVPDIHSLIWDDKLETMCDFGEETQQALMQLFDNEFEVCASCGWYYENAEKYVLKKYLQPVKDYLESTGKKAIFDLGEAEMQYYLAEKMINPITLKRKGFTLAVRIKEGRPLEAMGQGFGDLLIYEGYVRKLEDKSHGTILLVKPVRGMMHRLKREKFEFDSIRLETPALLAAIEGVYFSENLTKRGYIFDVCDEFCFEKAEDFYKYQHILICESCLFTKQEMGVIEEINGYGVKINDKNLLKDIAQEGEE